MSIDFELLKRICETPGVPGREEQVRDLMMQEMRSLVDTMTVDTLGNVIGLKRGNGSRKVMIAAHMDEIGFMVKHIDPKGFIRLQPLGGFDPRVLFAQRVIVHGHSGEKLRGVLTTSAKPAHLLTQDEASKPPRIEQLFVDVGLPAERVNELVQIGDMVTMDRTCEPAGDTVISKSLDDRLNLFIMLEAIRNVGQHEVDIYAVATVQEEVGLRGAQTAAYDIQPDIGIALDVTLAVDYPGSEEAESVTRMGQGTAIKIMDSSHISNPKLVDAFRDIAKREGIPYQMEILPRGGTDAGAMQRTRGGVASITLSTPTRYIHTVNEMANVGDIEAGITLLTRFLEEAHKVDYKY